MRYFLLTMMLISSALAMRDQGDEFSKGMYSLHGKLECLVAKKSCNFLLYPKTTRQLIIPVTPASFDRAILYNGMNIEARGTVDKAAKGNKVRFSRFEVIKVTPNYKLLDVVYQLHPTKKKFKK